MNEWLTWGLLGAVLAVQIILLLALARQARARRQDAAEMLRAQDRQGAMLTGLGGVFGQQGQAIERSMRAEEERMERLRAQMESRLSAIAQQMEAQRADNAQKLEAMRKTVDEQLQKTLDERLNQSFAQVSQRLEAVYRGLGEMQALAAGVGDLKRVLTGVKTRGIWGEIQLGALLEQMLSPQQFARNVQIKKNSQERVDFAVRMPGRDEQEMLLPIDAKFPQEDYQRLLDAYDAGDAERVAACGRALADAVKIQAKSIRYKYIDPPATSDFAILYLPVEGLYAEVLRQNGLVETLQRDFRVTVAGPTTLSALLNSLQMGFRTLAIEKRSSQVWKLLGQVKGDFGKFVQILERTQRALSAATNSIDDAARKTRTIERRLKDVEELPAGELLPGLEEGAEEED